MEEHIVQHEEEQRPFHEWHIQSLDLVNGELPHIIEVLILETVATNKEEQRHVEHRHKLPPHRPSENLDFLLFITVLRAYKSL